MTSKHNETSLRACHVCDKEFFSSETLTVHIENYHGATLRNNQHESVSLTCDDCGIKSKYERELEDHTRRYHFEKTQCGNYMCYDTEGVGLGCVCHLCDAAEDANISDVSLDEDCLTELKRLAGSNDEED